MTRVLPQPRSGLLGAWDRFVGPGMTRGELWLVFTASFASAGAVGAHLYGLGMGWPLALVGALIAFDVIGGAVCNMTDTTKRWVHRAGTGVRDHFGFIALHVAHIALLAWLFRGEGFDWIYALAISTCLLVSAVIIIAAPALLKSPIAVSLYMIALAIVLYGVGPTPGMEWFVPALFVKLLIGHAIPLQRH